MKTFFLSALIVTLAGALGHLFTIIILQLTGIKHPLPTQERLAASKWIGILERMIVALLVISGHVGESVFLFALKAGVMIYRTPDNSNKSDFADYVMVGTMASYLVGLGFGFFGHYILQ